MQGHDSTFLLGHCILQCMQIIIQLLIKICWCIVLYNNTYYSDAGDSPTFKMEKVATTFEPSHKDVCRYFFMWFQISTAAFVQLWMLELVPQTYFWENEIKTFDVTLNFMGYAMIIITIQSQVQTAVTIMYSFLVVNVYYQVTSLTTWHYRFNSEHKSILAIMYNIWVWAFTCPCVHDTITSYWFTGVYIHSYGDTEKI